MEIKSSTLTPEQYLARRGGISGSDTPVILGLNTFRSPIDVYLDKLETGPQPEENVTDAMLFGSLLEDVNIALYEQRENRKVRRNNRTQTHPKHSWLKANIDGKIVGEHRGFEGKNVGYMMAGDWGPAYTAEVPAYVIGQVHHYMLVMGWPKYDVSAVVGGHEQRVYYLERDKEFEEMIIDQTHDFWHNHVLAKIPPEPNWAAAAVVNERAFKRLWQRVNIDVITLDPEAVEWTEEYLKQRQIRLDAEKAEKTAKVHVQGMLGEAGTGTLPDGTGWIRKEVSKKEYTVKASSSIQTSFSKKPL